MKAITLDQLDEANLHLACAHAMVSVIQANIDSGAVQLSNDVISQALHGVGLMISAAGESLNGGQDEE